VHHQVAGKKPLPQIGASLVKDCARCDRVLVVAFGTGKQARTAVEVVRLGGGAFRADEAGRPAQIIQRLNARCLSAVFLGKRQEGTRLVHDLSCIRYRNVVKGLDEYQCSTRDIMVCS